MSEHDLQSLLWDAVTTDGEDLNGYQSTGIGKLAEILAGYERRIAELEKRLKEK
ncbi:hypothetical protein ACWEG1_05950 [Streptomyces bauhiniae]